MEESKFKKYIPNLRRFVTIFLISNLGIFIIVAVICWLVDWRSWHEYGKGLQIASYVVFLVGIIVVIGTSGVGSTRRPAMINYSLEREIIKEKIKSRGPALEFLILGILLALVLYGFGTLLLKIFEY